MKILLAFIVSGLSLSAFAGSEKAVLIQFETKTVTAELQAACVNRTNSEGESDGVSLFYDKTGYSEAKKLKDSGLTSEYLVGGSCLDSQGKGLTVVNVGTFAKNTEVNAAIEAAGGFKKTRIIFYNAGETQKAYQEALKNSFDSL